MNKVKVKVYKNSVLTHEESFDYLVSADYYFQKWCTQALRDKGFSAELVLSNGYICNRSPTVY